MGAVLARWGAVAGKVTLRGPRPGDLGWVVGAHGRHYIEGLQFSSDFEAVVARILGETLSAGGGRSRLWLAEGPDQADPLGCILCSDEGEAARLRLFLVAPAARRQGVGRALVTALIGHAAAAGFARVTLSTHAEHAEACRLYAAMGFTRLASARRMSFGRLLTVEEWALAV